MQYRKIDVRCLVANHRTVPHKGSTGNRIQVTDLALRRFMKLALQPTPLLFNHNEDSRIGHIASYSLDYFEGNTALMAHCRVTDLDAAKTLETRMPASVRLQRIHYREDEETGDEICNEIGITELSILTNGVPPAMAASRLMSIDPEVFGVPDPLPDMVDTLAQSTLSRFAAIEADVWVERHERCPRCGNRGWHVHD